MSIRILLLLVWAVPVLAHAGSAEELLARGDREHDAHRAAAALSSYEAASLLATGPEVANALAKVAGEAIDLAGLDRREQAALIAKAIEAARRAVVADPLDADAHFQLAQALGTQALHEGVRERVQLATSIRDEARRALELDPRHSGALHVLGVWNAEVMRLDGLSRMVAEHLLGGTSMREASWDRAQRCLEQAVQIDPTRIAHRLDLARIYLDRGLVVQAKAQLSWIEGAPERELGDAQLKQDAHQLLARV